MTRAKISKLQIEVSGGENAQDGLVEIENLVSLHISFIDQIDLS